MTALLPEWSESAFAILVPQCLLPPLAPGGCSVHCPTGRTFPAGAAHSWGGFSCPSSVVPGFPAKSGLDSITLPSPSQDQFQSPPPTRSGQCTCCSLPFSTPTACPFSCLSQPRSWPSRKPPLTLLGTPKPVPLWGTGYIVLLSPGSCLPSVPGGGESGSFMTLVPCLTQCRALWLPLLAPAPGE